MYTNTDVYTGEDSTSFTLTKVFAYMFGAIMLSFVVAGGIALLLAKQTIDIETFTIMIIGSGILLIIESIVIQWRFFRGGRSIMVPFIVYASTMGVLLSGIMLAYDMGIILLSFGITALLFGVLALYGWFSKKSLLSVGYVASALAIGALIIMFVNVIIQSTPLGWIVSLSVFAAMMLFTAFDVWRIKKIIETGNGSKNLALYCAFHLYVDFVYMFLRVLSIVARYANKR